MANYLKALGVFRLVTEQLNPKAKCFWQDTFFAIQADLNKDALLDYFCEHYSPTPLTAPWNGGSGFYPGDNTIGLDAIMSSNDPRFDRYKEVVEIIRSWPEIPSSPKNVTDIITRLEKAISEISSDKRRDELGKLIGTLHQTANSIKESANTPLLIPLTDMVSLAKNKNTPNRSQWNLLSKAAAKARTECSRMSRSGTKEQILAACRNRLPNDVLDWFDATYALNTAGEAFYSPLLGTGANEGRLDFTNNFMQRITNLLLKKTVDERKSLLKNALFGEVVSGLEEGKIGQYDPGRSGGYNQGMSIETKKFVINPWNFILALEGSIILASSMARRSPTNSQSWLSAPFSVRFSPLGFTSNEYSESGRGEIWMPLWESPTGIAEVKQLFGEGRSVVGRKASTSGLDFSRAVSTLGVDRGISAFERYAFLERRGQSYVALPAGRFQVQYKKSVELLNDLDPILRTLDNFLRRFPTIPASFLSARRQIDEALFACASDGSAYSFQKLVRTLGRMEQIIAQRDRSKEPILSRPLYGLSLDWIMACDNGMTELRIAAALASIGPTDKIGSIRAYLAGVSANSPYRWDENKNTQFWFGSSLPERLGQLLLRRQMDAERYGSARFPLLSYLSVTANDVMTFLYGETDDTLLEDLLWGFTLIDWRPNNKVAARKTCRSGGKQVILSRTWCLLKLLHTPYPQNIMIRREPRIGQLLLANRIPEACDLAIHRLKIMERRPFEVSYDDHLDSLRLLASLNIPISDYEREKIESLVLKPIKETQE